MASLVKTALSEIMATLEVLAQHGVDSEGLTKIRKDDGLAKKIADLIAGVASKVSDLFPVTVDYSRSLKEMIAAGKYDWINDDITDKHFPMAKGKAELNLELVHFNKYISSDDAIAELKMRGMRPATLWELLAFGEKFPEKQREFPVIALASVWRHFSGGRRVPCLWSGAGGRYLGLFWCGLDWRGRFRFLASRES